MEQDTTLGTGLLNVPIPEGAVNFGPALGLSPDLPKQFIVPTFSHWFDGLFNPIPDKVNTLINGEKLDRNQKWLDRCVGEAFGLQKTSYEKTFISSKDTWKVAKDIDRDNGYPLENYGATAWAGATALVNGVASESLVPSEVKGTRAENLNGSWVDGSVISERARFSGNRAYYVTKDKFKQTLFTIGHPIATYCEWYSGDNVIGMNGNSPMMGMPSGSDYGGHMFPIIGWIIYQGIECYVVANSWGNEWGYHGLFLVPLNGVVGRLGIGFVHVDKQQRLLADLLAQYDGKNVRIPGKPEHYRCELGVLRKYPDEIVWWAHGNLFGFNVYDIFQEDFDLIPKGIDMRIEDGKDKELVRQVRQFYGQL